MTLDEYINNFEFMTSNKPNLHAMTWFMNELNNPEKKLKFIHVAGTNGKGSICEMLTKVLINSGYKVGKFISPYLITLNEAICINNNYFSKDDETTYLPKIDSLVKEYIKTFNIKPSRFEIETTLAILYFLENNCDIVILEVGLGGMFDCTNIIPNSISIFGNISIDHTNILGNTLREITLQKAGIIKENSDTIKFEKSDVDDIISNVCKEKNNKLHIACAKDISNIYYSKGFTNIKLNQNSNNTFINHKSIITQINSFLPYQQFDYKNFKNIKLNLLGKKQIQNACVVLETLEILKQRGFKFEDKIIKNSLINIVHPARFETILENPHIIYDGAHNNDAIENFIETVKEYFDDSFTKTFVVSIIKNKDYENIITKLCNNFKESTFIFTNGTGEEKYLPKEVLFDFANNLNLPCNIQKGNFETSIKQVNSDVNFIVGSFYTYKLAKQVVSDL